eukprot:TRINITY_DN9628_c0_g1_i5.p1 TRINITY_DN9628_c0_g1~~TRINITY_DN9628_c0_g1_i5.p1  ORF type:complete len:173 (-),score=41.12 TRINITY_DN9628_c0_g1_i5:103-621(-)
MATVCGRNALRRLPGLGVARSAQRSQRGTNAALCSYGAAASQAMSVRQPSLADAASARAFASPAAAQNVSLETAVRTDGEEQDLDDLYIQVLQKETQQALTEHKISSMEAYKARYHESMHYDDLNMKGEKGPNHYGLHMPMLAFRKYNRGGNRGNYGTLYKSIGRYMNRRSR